MKKYFLYLLVLVASFSSCKNTKVLQSPCTGKMYEVLFVVNKTIWESTVGDTIKHTFREPMDGLPQDEPLFDLLSLPRSAFGSQLKSHRNIVEITISKKKKKAKILIKRNLLAKGQVYVRIVAPNKDAFIKLFEKNKSKIVNIFLKAERTRLKKYYRKYPDAKVFNQIKKKYGYSLRVPAGYNINKDTMGFVWISSETQKNSKGMFLYSFDYTDKNQFTEAAIVAKRNELLKKYIPGPLKNSYMTTFSEFPITTTQFKYRKHYAIESRGMWNVVGDFMAGPFVNLSILDEKNNRVICIDGYVYAPNEKKRNFMRQVESIMHTLDFDLKKKK